MANLDNPRTRNWTFILYPESAPANWLEIIQNFHIEWVLSPLHNKDVNPDDTQKKEHYHIIFMFGGLQTYEQVMSIKSELNECTTIVKVVKNMKSLIRYFAHLDNPDKYQYSILDVKCYGGVDLADLLKVQASERYGFISEMITYIKSNGITESQDLIDYAHDNHYSTWFQLLCDNGLFILDKYISSQRHRQPILAYNKLKEEFFDNVDI